MSVDADRGLEQSGTEPEVSPSLHAPAPSRSASEPPKAEYRAGKLCPRCGQGILDYDGLLNLVCPVCGPVQGGCFT